jgi:acyl-coenzyme A synthetase/AMP-(fatty) acid ligase
MGMKADFEKVEAFITEVEQSIEHFLCGVRDVPKEELRKAFSWLKMERASLQDEIDRLNGEVDRLTEWATEVRKNWSDLAASRLTVVEDLPQTIWQKIRRFVVKAFGGGENGQK